ncbi:CRISPR-associated protein [Mesotoga prima]|uniref:CRISPR-associated protein n=2 Tax=Mesotoga prima TaxID=1184387 RepID=UPI001BD6BDB5|nr:CRISPR-associated protein [Mesotoga prima]HQC15034.1 CRISPR-associated protein [Mesotoga prima]
MGRQRRVITNVGGTIWFNLKKMYASPDSELSSSAIVSYLRKMSEDELKKISPEINGLGTFGVNKDDLLIFIATNTDVSKACMEALTELYRSRGINVVTRVVEGLTDDSNTAFKKGIADYVDLIIGLFDNGEQWSYDNYFNATSGYRSLIPYTTIVAAVFDSRVFYLYENSPHLLELPPFPINFDFEIMEKHSSFFEKVDNDCVPVEEARKEFGNELFTKIVPQILLEEDGLVYLSNFGKILWGRYTVSNPEIYLSDSAQKVIDKDPVYLEYIKKMLRNEAEAEHQLHEYVGDAQCYKFPAKGVRVFYIRHGEEPFKIATILRNHDEYERYIRTEQHEATLNYTKARISI